MLTLMKFRQSHPFRKNRQNKQNGKEHLEKNNIVDKLEAEFLDEQGHELGQLTLAKKSGLPGGDGLAVTLKLRRTTAILSVTFEVFILYLFHGIAIRYVMLSLWKSIRTKHIEFQRQR